MPKDSFYKEPYVVVTMKCNWCGETLLYGLEKCRYCGEPVDADYAVQSALISTYINRAVALANTIQTGTPVMILFSINAIAIYLMDWKILFGLVLFSAFGYCITVIRWNYLYGDIETAEECFEEAKRNMKLHLNCWLAYLAALLFVLVIW